VFDIYNTGDTAHIDTIFKLSQTHQNGCIDILHCCNDPSLKSLTIAAVKNIDAPMLTRVWQEL
jgi:hypothetical protein